jgi:hypothetical protein
VCFSDDWAVVLLCITSSRTSEKKSRNSEQFDKFPQKKGKAAVKVIRESKKMKLNSRIEGLRSFWPSH